MRMWKDPRHYMPPSTGMGHLKQKGECTLWSLHERNDISKFYLFSMGYFIKEIKCQILFSQNCSWKNEPFALVFQLRFLVLPNFHSCFFLPFHVFYFFNIFLTGEPREGPRLSAESLNLFSLAMKYSIAGFEPLNSVVGGSRYDDGAI